MSDQDESIFGSNNVVPSAPQDQQVAEAPSQNKSYEDLLAMVVKEDGSPKYTNVEAAIRSIPHAQSHISTLEKELQELRVEVERRKTAEEVLENFKSVGEKNSVEKPSAPTLDLKDLDSIIERKLTEKDVRQKARDNVNTVMEKLTAKFGERADEMYKKAASEAGMSLSMMNQLAASSPNAVFKLTGVDAQQAPMAPAKTSGSINTGAIHPKDQEISSVISGNTTKDLVAGWRNAGVKVKQQLGVE